MGEPPSPSSVASATPRTLAETAGRRPALDRAELAELNALSQETDPALYFESLLAFGRRCELNGRVDWALSVYALLREGTGFPAIEARAQERLRAVQGVGAAGPRAEFLLRGLARQASDPSALFAMGVAGAVFRATRLAVLSRLATTSNPGFWTQALGAGRLASLAGFSLEAPAFALTARLGNEALGRHQPWDGASLGRDIASSYLVLGGLKLAGWASGATYRRLASPTGAHREGPLRMLFQQGGMLGGILLGHSLEERLGLRPHHDGATTLVDSLATLLQFNVAGRLTRQAFGPRFAAWERGLDLQSEALARRQPLRLFPDGGGTGLTPAWAARPASPASGTRETWQGPRLVFMEGLGGKNGPTGPSGGRPSEAPHPKETAERPGETAPADAGEPISWLPKGPQQLEVALREFLNMHPHAAAVFELGARENGSTPTSTVLMINRRLTEMFGYTEAEALGLSLQTFMHLKDVPFFRNLSEDLLKNGTLDLREARYRRKDGSSIWCNTSGMVKRVNGRTLGFAFLEDITTRRQERAALEASEVRNRALIGAIPDLLFRIRADMTFLDVRLPQAGQFVLPAERLIGTRVHELPLPEDLKQFGIETMRRALETGTFQRVEYELPMPDGSRRYQEARVSPSGADEVVVIVRDTTEIKRAEQHRIAAERLDAVQMLSRGLAHNIANRLAVVMPYQNFGQEVMNGLRDLFHLLGERPLNGGDPVMAEPFLRKVAELHAATHRGGSAPELVLDSPRAVYRSLEQVLTRALEDHRVSQDNTELILSAIQGFRRLSTEPQSGPPFDLNSLLETADLRGMLGPDVRLSVHRASVPAMAPGPRSHIADALQNLVVNARDAMQGRSRQELHVELDWVELGAEELAEMQSLSPVPLTASGGRFHRLSVRDTGGGMEEWVRSRIFEAYFSTKSTAQVGAGNRGLGLAMTLKHVKEAGGFLTVESRLNEGTTFRIFLPGVEAPRGEPVPEDPRKALERRLEQYFRAQGITAPQDRG